MYMCCFRPQRILMYLFLLAKVLLLLCFLPIRNTKSSVALSSDLLDYGQGALKATHMKPAPWWDSWSGLQHLLS